ncbi:hypothetical protein EJ03DRAFT_350202 [Teratosphaeria nubilosa]|uniref:Uncharacterized protein n=1 Tax=Teratosphaeria nubilosa TaxID=161662 RepID=A0A6G1LCJ0_9PEZI|nr:hypothetical protein EJ03DRAFT_350202 [Teratosphaeria nubilosa]
MAYRSASRSRVDCYRGRRDDCRRPQSARDRTPSDSSYDSYYDDDCRSRYSSRARRPSYYEPPPRPSADSTSGPRGINKATLAVGALTIIAGMLQMWTVQRSREQHEAARKERERDFRKRKEERRRMEAKRDQERQARWAAEREREREEAESETRSPERQIEYQPRGGRERDRTRVRRLPPPSGWVDGEVADDGYGIRTLSRTNIGFISETDTFPATATTTTTTTTPKISLATGAAKMQVSTLALALLTFISTAAAVGEDYEIYRLGGCLFESPTGGPGWNNCPFKDGVDPCVAVTDCVGGCYRAGSDQYTEKSDWVVTSDFNGPGKGCNCKCYLAP